jgi:hypothetical protein
MKYRALTSFVGHYLDKDGKKVPIVAHDGLEFDLPPGVKVDWVKAGLVEKVTAPPKTRRKPKRKAVVKPDEKAVE